VTAPIAKTTLCLITLLWMSVEGMLASRGSEWPGLISPGHVVTRSDAERTILHDDPVIQQALMLLGQAVNPIRIVSPDEIRGLYARASIGDPPAGLTAFRSPEDMSDPNIYVNKDSLVYRRAAQTRSAFSVLQLAATLAHEQVHNTDREFAAYRLQSDFVRSKLHSLPRGRQEDARELLQELDARARALSRAEAQLRAPHQTESDGQRLNKQHARGCVSRP